MTIVVRRFQGYCVPLIKRFNKGFIDEAFEVSKVGGNNLKPHEGSVRCLQIGWEQGDSHRGLHSTYTRVFDLRDKYRRGADHPQIMRPVYIPAIPVSRFRAGDVSRSIARQLM